MGTGKTHLVTALGVEACKQGHEVRFFRVHELVALLQEKYQTGDRNSYEICSGVNS